MTPEQFTYWLKGFLFLEEMLTHEAAPEGEEIVTKIREILNMVGIKTQDTSENNIINQ